MLSSKKRSNHTSFVAPESCQLLGHFLYPLSSQGMASTEAKPNHITPLKLKRILYANESAAADQLHTLNL